VRVGCLDLKKGINYETVCTAHKSKPIDYYIVDYSSLLYSRLGAELDQSHTLKSFS
jgi:hypothetical protein